jgi:hypothetical protein
MLQIFRKEDEQSLVGKTFQYEKENWMRELGVFLLAAGEGEGMEAQSLKADQEVYQKEIEQIKGDKEKKMRYSEEKGRAELGPKRPATSRTDSGRNRLRTVGQLGASGNTKKNPKIGKRDV